MTLADLVIMHYSHGTVSLTFWGIFIIVLFLIFISGD